MQQEFSKRMTDNFITALETKIREQTKSQKVGFLLGAGSSYLNGAGYPLAGQLWGKISNNIPETERSEIQAKLDDGAAGLEHALDLLDTGSPDEGTHRHLVIKALANHFSEINAPLEYHKLFTSLLSRREETKPVKVFSLNYDPLIERAAEQEHVRVFDGFHGHDCAFFNTGSFQHDVIMRDRDYRGSRVREIKGNIRLVKLHGSMGWYDSEEIGIRRGNFDAPEPNESKRLMMPPQYRKAQDTGRPPYSTLWSEFRSSLIHGNNLLNRLIAIGYGMADEHVNTEIENALERSNFTFIIITKELSDPAFTKWSQKTRVHVITENRCSLNGEIGQGHPTLSSFEGFLEGMNRW